MRTIAIAAAIALSLPTFVVADPIGLLAPDDPTIRSGWRPPGAPTADVQAFAPVDAKDWLQRGGRASPAGHVMGGMESMKGMPGMGQ